MNENSTNSSIINLEESGDSDSVEMRFLSQEWCAHLIKTEYIETGKTKPKTEYDVKIDWVFGNDLDIQPFNKKDSKLIPGRIINDFIGIWDNKDSVIDEKRMELWLNRYYFPSLPIDNVKLNLKETPYPICNGPIRANMIECIWEEIKCFRERPQNSFDVLHDSESFRNMIKIHMIEVISKCYKGINTNWKFKNSTFIQRIAENGRYKTITTYCFENVIDLILFDFTQIMNKTDKKIDVCTVCNSGFYISLNNKKHCSYCDVSKSSTKEAINKRVQDCRKRKNELNEHLRNIVSKEGLPPIKNRSHAKWYEYWSRVSIEMRKIYSVETLLDKKDKNRTVEEVLSDIWDKMPKNKLLP